MHLQKEKGRPAEGSPIPKIVLGRNGAEDTKSLLNLQVAQITRRCAISAAMAAVVAPIMFGEVTR